MRKENPKVFYKWALRESNEQQMTCFEIKSQKKLFVVHSILFDLKPLQIIALILVCETNNLLAVLHLSVSTLYAIVDSITDCHLFSLGNLNFETFFLEHKKL